MPVEQALSGPPARREIRRIEPTRGVFRLDGREIWRFRELLYFLIWRDVKARYKQTLLGAAWAILRPFVSMVIFTVVFGRLAGITSGSDVPYPLFLFAGLLLWLYFGSALAGGSASVVGNANIVGKAYFPRLYVPVAAVVAPLVDLVLAFVIFVGMFAWYQRLPSWHAVFLPLFVALVVLIGLGLGLWLAALTVRYHDVPYALPFGTQILMYLTPVIYPVTLVPERWRWALWLNPMSPAIEGFRWSLVGGRAPSAAATAVSVGIMLVFVASGLAFFGRQERSFADVI